MKAAFGPSPSPRTKPPPDRTFYLPRLPREYYQADAVIHWTLTIFDRQQGWFTPAFTQQFRELLLHTAARESLVCPIYCLMPDHLHLVWMGLRRETDQINAMAFLRTHLEPMLRPAKFQNQAQDNVLREQERTREAFARLCAYIAANPIRADLVKENEIWQGIGCILPGYPTLNPLAEDFWPKFWKIYQNLRQSDAANLKRPPW